MTKKIFLFKVFALLLTWENVHCEIGLLTIFDKADDFRLIRRTSKSSIRDFLSKTVATYKRAGLWDAW